MTHEHSIEARAIPALTQLVESVARTRRGQLILLDGTPVARMLPLHRKPIRQARMQLVDTGTLPAVENAVAEDLLTRTPGTATRTFSDAEMREAVDLDRAEIWHARGA